MSKGDLERIFDDLEPGSSRKWRHYFPIYERHLARYRGAEPCLVEIGVAGGGSLQLWKRYFGPGARIYGIDVDPAAAAFADDEITVFVGDQADRDFLREVAFEVAPIDILIDDGGHTMDQQRVTFEELFGEIDPNGIYICEDLHTSYRPGYGGGYRKKSSFIEYAKGFIDAVNAWHSRSRKLRVSEFTRSVEGLHFYDSVLVVEKAPVGPPVEAISGRPSAVAERPVASPRGMRRAVGRIIPQDSATRRVLRGMKRILTIAKR